MTKKRRSEEFKQQILKECDEVGNVALAKRWIEQGYPAFLVLDFIGIQFSTYYYSLSKIETKERKVSLGRPVSEYS